MDLIELIRVETKIEDKIFIFLGRVLEAIEGEYGALVMIDDKGKGKVYTRKRFVDQWIEGFHINNKIVDKALEVKKG